MLRPGYIIDNHTRLVEKLRLILDEASVEYDSDSDVVDDFTRYVRDWETYRSEENDRRQQYG